MGLKSMSNKEISEKIAYYIKDSGYRITAVADKTGIPYETLYRTLHGERKLKADEFLDLCLLLGIDVLEFAKEKETEKEE